MEITYWQYFFGDKRKWGNIYITLLGIFFYVMLTVGIIQEGNSITSLLCILFNTIFISANFILNYMNWKGR